MQLDGVRWLMQFLLHHQAMAWKQQWACPSRGWGSLSEKRHFRRSLLAWPLTIMLHKSHLPLDISRLDIR